MLRYLFLAIVVLIVVACPEPELTDDSSAGSEPIERVIVDNWCDAARGTAVADRTLAAGLSRAHVGHRLFGAMGDWLAADTLLVEVLEGVEAVDDAVLSAYADLFPTVCALKSTASVDGDSILSTDGTRAVIVPGNSMVSLPDDVSEVVIDLRELRSEMQVKNLIALALKETVSLGFQTHHVFHGFPSQGTDWTHYENEIQTQEIRLLGQGSVDLPLTFWVGPQLSPQVALWVGGLRLANRAAIVGYDVYSQVAESTFTGHRDGGLLWRSSSLSFNGEDWPDVIPADLKTDAPEDDFEGADRIDMSQAIVGTSSRLPMAEYRRGLGEPAGVLSLGTMRAALMVAYGTLDWFYPFFDLVGRDIDEALEVGLSEVNTATGSDRNEMKHILGRLMHSIHDGHGFYSDWASNDWSDGYLDIQIQEINGAPVVRTSAESEIQAGDTIVSIDGVAAADWYAEATTRYSASSDWYRFVLATDELKEVYGSKDLRLKNPEGEERDVTVVGTSWLYESSVAWGGSLRESGWMTDVGYDNVYYENMAGGVTPDITDTINNFEDYLGADAIILDMRDYPNLDIYEFARNFNPAAFTAPIFGFPTWSGANHFSIEDEIWGFEAGAHVYTGQVILMVSAKSVSAAECFAQMLMSLDNVTVVGQTSATTNGTITNAWLPGQYQITFTGMRLLNPDRTEFHGIGVIPDYVVAPTPAQFAAGLDPELDQALELVSSPN